MLSWLSDESGKTGRAEELFFPESEDDIRRILTGTGGRPVTIQGGRTGVTAGAVPDGGIVINLSRMDRIIRVSQPASGEDDAIACVRPASGEAFAVVQPGLRLSALREQLQPQGLLFAPDPTETTATLGGMANCNSSGARSFRFGAMRDHVRRVRVILADGDCLELRRGQHAAGSRTITENGAFSLVTEGGRTISGGRAFSLVTESGRTIRGHLPDIKMPDVRKSTAGYWLRPGMDLLDLFIGSEGTLGIISEIELRLLPLPKHIWACMFFPGSEKDALALVRALRAPGLPVPPDAIEFFGTDTLDMLREAQESGRILTDMSPIPGASGSSGSAGSSRPAGASGSSRASRFVGSAGSSCCAVYTEFSTDDRSLLEPLFRHIAERAAAAGCSAETAWAAITAPDLKKLKDFRHAAPVCVNEKIREIRNTFPEITKLGTDMSVPDSCLERVFAMYRAGLGEGGFQSSLFGHIGDNHLHVNIIPRTPEEYRRGKELYTRWAEEVVRMGGSVSAEHGIGKLKTWLLQKQYSRKELSAMLELKKVFDPPCRLNPGNIF